MDPSPEEKPGTPVPGETPVLPGFALRPDASGRDRDFLRIGAAIVAGLAIVMIVVSSVTDLSEAFVPMEDVYLDILIPETEDDTLPFALNELSSALEGNRISASGWMTNMSLEPVENVVAVITARETTGRFPETVEVPVEPARLEPGDSGSFSVSVTLRQRPNNYSVRFRLEHGPFVPHSDERSLSIEIDAPIDLR
jgi:hypothetical protein